SAIHMLEKARSLAGEAPIILGALGHACGLAGQPDRARALLENLERASKERYVTQACRAVIHLGLGEHQQALSALEAGCQRREVTLVGINVNPIYDPVRKEP